MTIRSRCVLSVVLFAAIAGCTAPSATRRATAGDERPASGMVDPAHFREGRARGGETIFSELPLPTPSGLRTASGAPGPDYWQQQVDYSIDATLDADAHRLSGRQVMTYTNNSPDPLPYLWVHLEQNLFKGDSLGALSTEPQTRFGHHGFDGGIEFKAVRLAGERGEPRELKVTVFDTLARVELPEPVAPKGGKVRVSCEWSFAIPDYGADRMGIQKVGDGEIFEIAQWFPAAAVYDDVHGWNTLPYLGQGEFYTNYGNFDVRLTVPRSHIVAATGELQNAGDVLTDAQRERMASARATEQPVMIVDEADIGKPEARPAGDGPLTWHFQASCVRTFAWASSPAFLWDGCFAKEAGPTPPGRDSEPQGTLCMSVYPREALPLWKEKASDDLRWSIEHYSKKWHRYPYPAATNVNGIVGGMEYPMVIFCSERKDEQGLFGVTTHEIGHNWFPMLVSTDERRHAWMDEGFNSFINIYAGRERYTERKPEGRTEIAEHVKGVMRGEQQPMEIPADRVWRGRLGYLEYGKTAVALKVLREDVLGPERFDFAFRRYIDLWAFKSPMPADFFRCMEDAAGMDLAWFWRGWITEVTELDQAVGGVTYTKDGKPLVSLLNKGEMVMPVTLRVTYEGGGTENRKLPVEIWYATNQWTAMWDSGGKKITKVEIDPEVRLPDVDRSNNVWGGTK